MKAERSLQSKINVAVLVYSSDGTTLANYEYGPFGEVIRATGPMAKANPFRFSTKYQDDETDFLNFGHRYYNPSTGKWISRDPINEPGFYLLTTGGQVSENSNFAGGSTGDGPNLNDFLTAGGANVYAFVDNDAVDQSKGSDHSFVRFLTCCGERLGEEFRPCRTKSESHQP